ncbi:MAG: ATP-binding protein [Woeseiaceae bacterium]|nr:ATP-binding protein [Woeseiaceae bacterium]
MTLKRQLFLVSLLALLLPWAGCEFIRETESALRVGQQQMLAGTARAFAITMANYAEEYPPSLNRESANEQLFIHTLEKKPRIDGYFDDWILNPDAKRSIRGSDGAIQIALASYDNMVYVYADVSDRNVVYATTETMLLENGPRYADYIVLVSNSSPQHEERFIFTAEAPGAIVSYKKDGYELIPESSISAHWQDVPGGYRLEAQIPANLLRSHLGLLIYNTANEIQRPTRSSSFSGQRPKPAVLPSNKLRKATAGLAQPGMRIFVTDSAGWRLSVTGELSAATTYYSPTAGWSNRIYDLLVESGTDAASAEPHASGREQQPYVSSALDGREMAGWYRSKESGRAIVAVAAPILNDDAVIGALVLQNGTDAILSSTNAGLARLINLTLIATVLVAGVLVAYATWLSRRIRHLSIAAEGALENETLHIALPSALAVDEIGDLSRSFSNVLKQLGDYNNYLRTLASKLSHELRTPLAIVTSSLENLEQEALNEASSDYTTRALEGANRLRRILSAMSEASRVEEVMKHAELKSFDLHKMLQSTVEAYRDVYTERNIIFTSKLTSAPILGSPELLIQMLDKLIDNAVDFSASRDTIEVRLSSHKKILSLSVTNPGPALPESMRMQLFDSMVSMREGESTRHLGLGLYIAKLIVEGHSGSIRAKNVNGGVMFEVSLSNQNSP